MASISASSGTSLLVPQRRHGVPPPETGAGRKAARWRQPPRQGESPRMARSGHGRCLAARTWHHGTVSVISGGSPRAARTGPLGGSYAFCFHADGSAALAIATCGDLDPPALVPGRWLHGPPPSRRPWPTDGFVPGGQRVAGSNPAVPTGQSLISNAETGRRVADGSATRSPPVDETAAAAPCGRHNATGQGPAGPT